MADRELKLQADGKPRAGRLDPDTAKRHHMTELLPKSGVYVFPKDLKEVQRRETGASFGRYLLSVFYTNEELVEAGNLTGRNDKKGLDDVIIDTIITYSVMMKGSTSATIKTGMRNKISALVSYSRKDEMRRDKENE